MAERAVSISVHDIPGGAVNFGVARRENPEVLELTVGATEVKIFGADERAVCQLITRLLETVSHRWAMLAVSQYLGQIVDIPSPKEA